VLVSKYKGRGRGEGGRGRGEEEKGKGGKKREEKGKGEGKGEKGPSPFPQKKNPGAARRARFENGAEDLRCFVSRALYRIDFCTNCRFSVAVTRSA